MSRFVIALPLLALVCGAGALTPSVAHADNLLIHRVQRESQMALPTRGMSMAQVERRYGAPQRKLSARGGDSAAHPVIHRWLYPSYIVYFERSHVIHAVLNTPAGNNRQPQNAH
jgi:hypothetical protein